MSQVRPLRPEERRVLRLRFAWDLYVAHGDRQDTARELEKALEAAEQLLDLEERLYGGGR